MKQYRIGDFAEQMGVSIDFIKYYEEKGLLSSWKDPKNRYHYYPFHQASTVMQILYFRSLGYNVKEIYDLLHNMDEEACFQQFANKANELEASREKLNYTISQLRFFQSALQRGKKKQWYITQVPSIYFLPHTNGEEYIRDDRTSGQIRQWNGHFPFVYILDRWFWDEQKQQYVAMQHGRAIESDMAQRLQLDVAEPASQIPATRCLEYYLNYSHDTRFDHQEKTLTTDKYEEVFRVIRQQNFKIVGDMFVRYITLTDQDGKQNELDVVYIPIE